METFHSMAPPMTLANDRRPRTGLVGLGLMGRGLGLSLQRAGHALTVLAHRQRAVADELVAAGANEAPQAAALAAAVDTVVLCLPSEEAVNAVLFGPQGLCSGARAGLLVIECSTLRPDVGQRLARRLAEAGVHFVDAPVTRGPNEAVQGRLNALVGGAPAAVERAQPVLRAFCEQVFCFGAAGQGYAAKLVSNFLAFSNLVAVAEAMHTARQAGLDLPQLLAAIQVSGGQNRVLDGLAPLLAGTGPSRSRVTLDTAHKDVQYYLQVARGLGSAGPMAQQVAEQLAHALAAGLGPHFTPDYLNHVAGRPMQDSGLTR